MTTNEPKVVDYILVAEFDQLKGNTISFQYPAPPGEDTQLLAELMLPDGVHKRDDDWTVFFLGRTLPSVKDKAKKSSEEEGAKKGEFEAYIYEYKEENQSKGLGWIPIGNEKQIVILLNSGIKIMSKDNTQSYFITKHADLEYTQLEPLFECVLADSGTAVGLRFTAAEHETMFVNHMEFLLQELEASKSKDTASNSNGASTSSEDKESNNKASNKEQQFLYCLSLCNNQKDDKVRRGATVKAMALCTIHPFIQVFKPIIILGLQKFFANPSEQVLEELYTSLNAIDMSQFPKLSDHQKQIRRNSGDKFTQEIVTQVAYDKAKMNLKLPTTLFPDEVGDYKVINLIKKFGSQVPIIYNALLLEKRILFLGFESSAGEVCEYVLAACSMVCPPLKGLIHRAFPYTNLTYLDFLSVPGYIAGVINPMFETHPEWWDILCNINTGKITISGLPPNQQPEKQPYSSYDNELMSQMNAYVSSHYGEDTVRSLFQGYTQHIVDMALDEEEFPDEYTKLVELENNRSRLEAWKKSLSCQHYLAEKNKRREESAIKDPMVFRYIKKLRTCSTISEQEMMVIYQTFLDNIKTEEQLQELLSYLPESNGGLTPLAVSLYHSSEAVRNATATLFRRFDKMESGSALMSNLNYFLKQAYEKIAKSLPSDEHTALVDIYFTIAEEIHTYAIYGVTVKQINRVISRMKIRHILG